MDSLVSFFLFLHFLKTSRAADFGYGRKSVRVRTLLRFVKAAGSEGRRRDDFSARKTILDCKRDIRQVRCRWCAKTSDGILKNGATFG